MRNQLVDVQDKCFVVGEMGGVIHLHYYNMAQPDASISVQEVEKQTVLKPIHLRMREIRHISFDHVFNNHVFAFLTEEMCCVYDVANPTTPLNILTIHNCQTLGKKLNSIVHFHSFAFCGNGQMLIITDKDVFRWDYNQPMKSSQTLSSVYHQTSKSSFRRITFKPEGNLIGRLIIMIMIIYRNIMYGVCYVIPLHSSRK